MRNLYEQPTSESLTLLMEETFLKSGEDVEPIKDNPMRPFKTPEYEYDY